MGKCVCDAVCKAELLRQLYEALLGPVEEHLAGAEELLIVPSQCLSNVPWAALVAADGRYLIERFVIRVWHRRCGWRGRRQRGCSKERRVSRARARGGGGESVADCGGVRTAAACRGRGRGGGGDAERGGGDGA